MSDFAKLVIEVDSNGVVTAKKIMGELGSEAGKTETKTKTLGDRFKDLQAVMQGPVAAFEKVKAAMIGIYQVADETITKAYNAEKSFAILSSTLRMTGANAWTSSKEVRDMADGFQELTGRADDEIIAMENVLLGFRNIKGDNFKEASLQILNMADVMGSDLVGAAQAIGKALDDPVKGLDSLSRQGFRWTEAEKEVFASMVEMGDITGAQDLILKELNKTFGDAAKAAGETAPAAFNKMKLAIDDVKEAFGMLIAEMGKEKFQWWTKLLNDTSDAMSGKALALRIQDAGKFTFQTSGDWDKAISDLERESDRYQKLLQSSISSDTSAKYAKEKKLIDDALYVARLRTAELKNQEAIEQKRAEAAERKAAADERAAKAAEELARYGGQASYYPSVDEFRAMSFRDEKAYYDAVRASERELGITIANNTEINKEYNKTLEVSASDMKIMGSAVDKLAMHMYDLTEAEKLSNAAYKDLEKTFADFGAGVLFDLSSAYFNAMGEAIGGSTTAAKDMADTMRELGQSILDELPRLMFYAGVKMLEVDPTLGIALILGSGLVSIGAGAYRAGVASAGGSAPIAETPTLPATGGGVSLSIINQSGVALQGDVMETQSATGGRSLELTVRRMVANTIASGGADSALRSRPNGRAIPLRRG